MPNMITPTSYLFVPGNRPGRFEKAFASGADAVILDLEDAVPPSEKQAARSEIATWLNPARQVVIRINATDTEWFRDDLTLCAQPGVMAVMLPKAEHVDDILRVAHASPFAAVLPLVETARGFANLGALARARNVQRLVFGTIDFQLDMGIFGDGDELLYFRSRMVLESRIAGIAAPVDGVSESIEDTELLRADALRARRQGFGGKLCIHPVQVAAVNAGFTPSADEVAWANRVVAAAKCAGNSAVTVDGRMVDRPVVLRAEALLRQQDIKHGV